jgi:hypothetical protein
LVLLAAGPALSAPPVARKPLPETAVLDRVDGRLVHIDANDTWLFELAAEVKTPEYQRPAGTRFVLLPSATLGRLIADVNDRAAPRYRLLARVTSYQGRNYLLPMYYLPLSAFKSEQKTEEEGQKTEGGAGKTPPPTVPEPTLTVPPEILEQLQKQRPLPGPRKSVPAPKQTQEVPDRMLVDCVGRIESSRLSGPGCPPPTENQQPTTTGFSTGLVLVPYALGWNISNVRYELLPSAALEEALQKQAQATDPIRFSVAGLVTEFKGKKYLLLQRAVVVYSYGNFGR